MKISKERVARLARSMADALQREGLVNATEKKERLVSLIDEAILSDLQVEDRLNAEVRMILERYAGEIECGAIDYQKMFLRVKKQLIQDRDLVL